MNRLRNESGGTATLAPPEWPSADELAHVLEAVVQAAHRLDALDLRLGVWRSDDDRAPAPTFEELGRLCVFSESLTSELLNMGTFAGSIRDALTHAAARLA